MMKNIIFNRSDGGLSVVHPVEGTRLANSITLSDGTVLSLEKPSPVDKILRGWPIKGAVADWAESEDEFVNRIAVKDIPVTLAPPVFGLPAQLLRAEAAQLNLSFIETVFAIVDESAVPTDRTFRNAWMKNGNDIEVNMAKAREIHRENLRQLRAPILAKLDIDYLRAVEVNDEAAKMMITAQKQKLRDVTDDSAIFAAPTPEALKAVMPAVLTAELVSA